jgi:hypothetical protein
VLFSTGKIKTINIPKGASAGVIKRNRAGLSLHRRKSQTFEPREHDAKPALRGTTANRESVIRREMTFALLNNNRKRATQLHMTLRLEVFTA